MKCKYKLNVGLVQSRDLGNKMEVTFHIVGTENSPTHAVSIADRCPPMLFLLFSIGRITVQFI